MVEIKHLTRYYGKNPAVKNISFEIQDHEILGFLGPNGAGKSTTMNMIAGYLPSTSGTVVVNGYDITEQAVEAKKCIGYLPEIPPVYPEMRVEEYLRFGRAEGREAQGCPGADRESDGAAADHGHAPSADPQPVQGLQAACRLCTGIAR